MEPQSLPRWKQGILFLLNPKVGIPLALVAALLLSPLIYRAHRLSGLPEPADPFDVAAFGTVELSDEDNAFVEYRAAAALLVPRPTVDKEVFNKAIDEGWPSVDETIRQWVVDNRAALELWRQGTAKPDAVYLQPKDLNLDSQFRLVEELRTLAQLARLEGARLEAEGKPAEAWNWYRAIFRSSRHCGRHGFFLERLVGISIHYIASTPIAAWAADPRLSTRDLRQALDDLVQDDMLTVPQSVAFKAGYLWAINSLEHPWIAENALNAHRELKHLGRAGLFLMNEPEVSRRVLPLVYTNWLAQIDRPRHLRTHLGSYRSVSRVDLFAFDPTTSGTSAPLLDPREIDTLTDRTILATTMVQDMPQMDNAVAREEARQRTLMVTLACQLYHREHGRFPDNLEGLVDGCLAEIPIDPYAPAGKPLRYRRDDDEAIVWSIGENGVDDGGDVQRANSYMDGDVGFRIKSPNSPKGSGVQNSILPMENP